MQLNEIQHNICLFHLGEKKHTPLFRARKNWCCQNSRDKSNLESSRHISTAIQCTCQRFRHGASYKWAPTLAPSMCNDHLEPTASSMLPAPCCLDTAQPCPKAGWGGPAWHSPANVPQWVLAASDRPSQAAMDSEDQVFNHTLVPLGQWSSSLPTVYFHHKWNFIIWDCRMSVLDNQ